MRNHGFARPARRLLSIALVLLLLPAFALGERWRFGDPNAAKIAITMDDCYRMTHVTDFLDLCDLYGIKATFFPVGNSIKPEDGDIWRRIVENGYEIGNHTYGHPNMSVKLSYDQTRRQFVRMEKALDTALGYHYEIQLFRPPYGALDGGARDKWFKKCGYQHIILWSVDSTDPDACIRNTKNGSILLFHANDKDVKALETVIPALLELGFECVTVSELIGAEPIVKERTEKELVFPPAAVPAQ